MNRFYKVCVILLASINTTIAEELPLYELGVGVAGIITPHYPGADQDHNLIIPVPYPIYRGKWLRADNSGVKTFLFDKERYDLNLSFGIKFPVNSDKNDARSGMPDLDWIFEVGPTFRYTAWQSEDNNRQLRLDFPVRGAISVDVLDPEYQGITSSPGIAYFNRVHSWKWTMAYAAILSNRKYHGYFYDVDPVDVTPERDLFRAKAGYTASRFTLSTTRRYGDWFFGGFIRYLSLHGATNDASPLLRKNANLSAGFILAWVFKKSETMVTVHPEAQF